MSPPFSLISYRIALYSLYGFLAFSPISIALAQIFYGLALLATIVTAIAENRFLKSVKLDIFAAFVGLFVIWSILSALANNTPVSSLLILKEEWLFLMIPVAAYILRDKETLKRALSIFAVSVIIVSIYSIWQHWGGMDLVRGTELYESPDSGYRVRGFFTHRLTFGNYFAIAAVLLLSLAPSLKKRPWKIIFYVSFFLASLATIMTYSRGPVAYLIFGVLLFILMMEKKYSRPILIVLAVLVIAILVGSPDFLGRYKELAQMELKGKSGASRISIWRGSYRMAVDNPVFGVGPGNFKDKYKDYRDSFSKRVWGHAHNDFLNIAAYAGFPAAVFFFGFWIIIIVRMAVFLNRSKVSGFDRGILLGILIGSIVFYLEGLTEAVFADEEVRLLLMVLWGIYFALEQRLKARV